MKAPETNKTVSAIANRLLRRAAESDKVAAKSHLYESRLRAEGRAAAYRSAAALVAKQLRRKKPDRRYTNLINRLSDIVKKV